VTATLFILECFEEETCFLKTSVRIFAEAPALCDLLGIGYTPASFALPVDLEPDVARRVFETHQIAANADEAGSWWTVRQSSALDFLPYEVHTNREFELMMRGTKPLSVFSDWLEVDRSLLAAISEKFRPHIASGRFIERHYTRLPAARSRAASMLLIARTSEEWRIDAYILLRDEPGWNDDLERRQGSLLGYESWQTDAFLQAKKMR
jgi:hypothetical protein